MTFLPVYVITNIVWNLAQGCEHIRILACTTGVQQEIAYIKFITNIDQLNSYCDKIAMAHLCVLHESQHCSKELRSTYQKLVDAERVVTKKLCRPGIFRDEYLEEANCVASFFSTSTNGACSDAYSRLLAAVSHSTEIQSNLQNLCCAYFAVNECAQLHGSRCGKRSSDRSILRQIFEGMDHNCRSVADSCTDKLPYPDPSQTPNEQVHSSVQSTRCIRLSSLIWLSLRIILVWYDMIEDQ